MPRTVISLPEEDKLWLDRKSAEERVPMTELVRRAVREYRERHGDGDGGRLDELLALTTGRWSGGDGLLHQNTLRDEWEDRT